MYGCGTERQLLALYVAAYLCTSNNFGILRFFQFPHTMYTFFPSGCQWITCRIRHRCTLFQCILHIQHLFKIHLPLCQFLFCFVERSAFLIYDCDACQCHFAAGQNLHFLQEVSLFVSSHVFLHFLHRLIQPLLFVFPHCPSHSLATVDVLPAFVHFSAFFLPFLKG